MKIHCIVYNINNAVELAFVFPNYLLFVLFIYLLPAKCPLSTLIKRPYIDLFLTLLVSPLSFAVCIMWNTSYIWCQLPAIDDDKWPSTWSNLLSLSPWYTCKLTAEAFIFSPTASINVKCIFIYLSAFVLRLFRYKIKINNDLTQRQQIT